MQCICFILLQCITVQRNTKGENMPTQAPVSLCRDFDFTDKCTRCTWRDPQTPIQLSCLCCCCSRCIYILSAPASALYRWFPLRTELSGFSEAALIPSVPPIPPPAMYNNQFCTLFKIWNNCRAIADWALHTKYRLC